MKKSFVLFVTALVFLWSQSLTAQDRFAIELQIGASFTTQDLGDADLNTGIGSEIIFDYEFLPHLGAFVGWGYNRFSADESFAGKEADVEETGYLFGLQYNYPIGESPLAIFARAGGIYNHIEIENKEGDITADSGHGLGWRVGAGLDVSLGSNWHLKPRIKYQSLSRDIEMEVETTSVDLTYISVGLGIAKKF